LLLVGNHDLSPAVGRANALHEFDTLQVPHVQVLGKPTFLGPHELEGLPLQVLALPWITRSGLMAATEMSASQPAEVFVEIENRLVELVQYWLEQADPALPTILMAHATVQGAVYGGERLVMLGGDLALPGSLVRDPRLDYVALGHIHKPQDLNEGVHPPVIYPGSIERVDFGEAQDDKSFVIARIARGHTQYERRALQGRRFIDRAVTLTLPSQFGGSGEHVFDQLVAALPPQADLAEAVVRLVVEYPREWDAYLDETTLRSYTEAAFEFHLVRRPKFETRLRLPGDAAISSLSAVDLLEKYWEVMNSQPGDNPRSSGGKASLDKLVQEIMNTPLE
jgi:exonuclease SbcD